MRAGLAFSGRLSENSTRVKVWKCFFPNWVINWFFFQTQTGISSESLPLFKNLLCHSYVLNRLSKYYSLWEKLLGMKPDYFLGGEKIVNSWAIHGLWLCSLYIKMFGMWTITSFSFSQSLLESIKSDFCWVFFQKYVNLFLLHLFCIHPSLLPAASSIFLVWWSSFPLYYSCY